MLSRKKNFVLDILDQFEVFFSNSHFHSGTRGMGKFILKGCNLRTPHVGTQTADIAIKQCHEDVAVLSQFCAKPITLRL